MNHRTSSNVKTAELPGATRKQIELIASIEEFRDVGFIFPAAANTAHTNHLQPIKESTPAGKIS